MKQKNWHGTDRSNEVSLFEYGFLVRNVSKSNELQVIYRNETPNGTRYSYGWFDAESYRKDCAKKDSWCFMEEISDDDLNLLSDLLWHWGVENIFGSDYSGGYTENEIRQRLNKAL